jgi:hypothetical protein
VAKTTVQVYTDEETKRRIELAAARRDIAVTQYCLEAIKRQLAKDDVLERETIEMPVRPVRDTDLVANLRALHREIKAYRGGGLIDLDHKLEQIRQERDRLQNG